MLTNRKTYNRIVGLITGLNLLISTAFMGLTSVNSFADGYWTNGGSDIAWRTADAKAHSSVRYRTELLTVTRCAYDPTIKEIHPTGESHDFKKQDNGTTYYNNGQMMTTEYFVPLDDIIAKASAEWAKEIQDALSGEGPAVYLKFDSVMYVYRVNSDGTRDVLSGPYTNYPSQGGHNPVGINSDGLPISKAAGWSSSTKGWESHFNQYILIGKQAVIEPTPIGDDEFVTFDYTMDKYAGIDANQPSFAMGNWSNQFNLAEGIPSSEDVSNKFLADKWYGSTRVWARTIEKEYNWTMHYWWFEDTSYWRTVSEEEYEMNPSIDPDRDGKEWVEDYTIVSTDQELPLKKAYVSFQYLADTQVHDFTNGDVENGAYPGDHIYYDDTIETPIECVSSYAYEPLNRPAGSPAEKGEPDWNADSEKHVEFLENINYQPSKQLNSASEVANAILEDTRKIQEQISAGTRSRNDKLIIDGIEYMNNDWVNGCDFYDYEPTSYKECQKSAGWKHDYMKQGGTDGVGPLHMTDPQDVTGTTTVTIPSTVDNGQYFTTLNVYYQRLLAYTKTLTNFNSDTVDAQHIINGYEGNEPIFVHTPVISPVSIRKGDGSIGNGGVVSGGSTLPNGGKGSTQLVSENSSAWYQLILDNEYIMHWDSAVHREIMGYGDSGENPSKYDKYTQDKWMKFPFEVYYEGVFYDLQEDKYTDWIRIRRPVNWTDTVDNHWINTPIYIPSYSREMGEAGNEGSIFYKVEAINVDGDMAQHFDEMEGTANKWCNFVLADDGAKYVATYEIPIQLSGIIYDFSITGTTNSNLYEDESSDIRSNITSFVMSKNEKKTGTKNRIGESAVRYLLDGSITNSWNPLNTIPMANGKSKNYTSMGALWKGQTFSFTVKTIANLWNDNGNMDRMEIIPTFRYVGKDGRELDKDKIKIYYDNPDGSGTFIEYGSVRDTLATNWMGSNIGSPMQEGAYYTQDMTDTENGGNARKYHYGNWPSFTVYEYNKTHGSGALTVETLLNRKVNSYCLSHIILNPKLRLLSGEWEQLKWNIEDGGKDFESVTKYPDIGSWDDPERFRYSMQTWYGEYYIPSNLYVVDLTKHPGFDIQSYMENANGGLGITQEENVFEKVGYLIVNFDIRTYNEGKTHLKYKGGADGGNMWETEGFNHTPIDPDIPSFYDGDVIVIDLERSTTDKVSSGLYDIN